MRGQTQLLSARSVRWIDVGVAVWVVVWAALGVLVWHDIDAQITLGTDVMKIGIAVEKTGQALGIVGGLPLVGDSIGDVADRIEAMGVEVKSSGQDSRAGITRTAVIAGLGVGVLPATMILLLYLPARMRWRRYVRAIAAALPGAAGDPAFEQYLARRAIDALSWDDLRCLSDDPWYDIEGGDCRVLADAELARLGLARP